MKAPQTLPLLSDIEISRRAPIQPIETIAHQLGIPLEMVETYGRYKAKIRLEAISEQREAHHKGLQGRFQGGPPQRRAHYIDVTAITPTPLGEGKTTTTVGLVQGLGFLGKKAVATLRQPSLGPTFGIKGGAAGGGYSQVIPMEDINLHLTGDIHAVAAAHNLCAAAIDARLYHENRWSDSYFEKIGLSKLHIDPTRILIGRVVDMNDRVLRHVTVGMGSPEDGPLRESHFDIAVASEVMAILALAKNITDLRQRIGTMVVAYDTKGKPLTAEDFGVAGAMTALLREAIKPNLLQTLEGQGAFIHTGPFANIAHGNSSILADELALQYADYVVTESGFGADRGFEKFADIKCRTSGYTPDAAVLVCTVRALKVHGGGPAVVAGKPLSEVYKEENLELLKKGLANLEAHLRIVQRFGIPAVVAINAFPTDTEAEWECIREAALRAGAFDAVVSHHWGRGGEGAAELAAAVVRACETPSTFRFLYSLEWPLEQKIETIAREIYGADGVDYTDKAREELEHLESQGFGKLPICMAKTQYSLSHDPELKGAPKGWRLPIRELRLAAGAGFVYPLCGDITTMPGLPSKPAFMNIDIDEQGNIQGLS
ncbi:MAG TPA: formate--tetrahydrofolate ligase [Termitinemataceae bacterium]|nr:formate--tetrahydrofolate ligase [Termitinemataceae bacterium]HOM24203.1 formate--tetrahydrofolate ligase [Termitinemataceae bacterium]HPQ01232.1 formate--tetrahydrofolate ligase [Termitinemataceae bacterium]